MEKICGQRPPGIVASAKVMTTGPPQLSVAVAIPVPVGEESSSHSMIAFAGQVITGGTLS